MGKPEAVAAAIDAETLTDLKRLAEHMDGSIDHLVTTAVLRFVNEEIGAITPDKFAHLPMPPRDWDAIDRAKASLSAWLKEGDDAIERGDVIWHEDLMTEMRERYVKRRAA